MTKLATRSNVHQSDIPPLLPREQVAKLLGGVGVLTVKALTENDPDFPRPVLLGARIMYREADVKRYIAKASGKRLTRPPRQQAAA